MSRDVAALWAETAAAARLMAERSKLPMEPFERLTALYCRLDDEERKVVNRILSDEALALDVGVRFDALALINELGVVESVPALRQLLDRFEAATDVGAGFEADKVRKMISALSRGVEAES